MDQNWKYENLIPISVSGFNPFESAIFYSKKSYLSEWLKAPELSARTFNLYDRLVHESLFMAHDYLHSWAASVIQELAQKNLSYGYDAIDEKNIEAYVFCHLLTEAAATVGLDYWFLSQVHLNEICPVGTRMRCLTIGYHRDYNDEIKKFNSNFNVNSEKFFKFIAEFYCSGVFSGFSIEDLRRSPILLGWLDHEVTYGEKQREYARRWFSSLSKENSHLSPKQLARPIAITQPWQKRLIGELGEALWKKVRYPRSDEFPLKLVSNSRLWKHAEKRGPDPRFMNLNHFDPNEMAQNSSKGANRREKFSYLVYQYISQFDFNACDPRIIKIVPDLIIKTVNKMDITLMQSVFAKQRKIPLKESEPKHILMLN